MIRALLGGAVLLFAAAWIGMTLALAPPLWLYHPRAERLAQQLSAMRSDAAQLGEVSKPD
jgi:hypothetical protein